MNFGNKWKYTILFFNKARLSSKEHPIDAKDTRTGQIHWTWKSSEPEEYCEPGESGEFDESGEPEKKAC